MGAKNVKREIKFDNLVIRLYKVDIWEWLDNTVANVEAYGPDGKILWIIESPPYSKHYFDMQIDEENGELIGDGGDGMVYRIDLRCGKIISSQLIK